VGLSATNGGANGKTGENGARLLFINDTVETNMGIALVFAGFSQILVSWLKWGRVDFRAAGVETVVEAANKNL
jgi:hypothetical protein